MICLATNCISFSQSISNESEAANDTVYNITAAQLRATCKIFSEHDFQKTEIIWLNHQMSLLSRSDRAKEYIIKSQGEQISTLSAIIAKRDEMIANNNTVIETMKRQAAEERKKQKKDKMIWCGGGIVAGLIVGLILN